MDPEEEQQRFEAAERLLGRQYDQLVEEAVLRLNSAPDSFAMRLVLRQLLRDALRVAMRDLLPEMVLFTMRRIIPRLGEEE